MKQFTFEDKSSTVDENFPALVEEKLDNENSAETASKDDTPLQEVDISGYDTNTEYI